MCLSDPLYLPPPSLLVNIYWYVDKRGITSSVTGNLLQSIGILRMLPHMLYADNFKILNATDLCYVTHHEM